MIKAKLIFNIEDREDHMDLMRALSATDMAIILWETIHNSYRKLANHDDVSEDYKEGVIDTLEHVRDLCAEHGIDVDKLIE